MVKVAVIVLLLFAPRLFACSCMRAPTRQAQIDAATLIFSGRVVSVENAQQARLNAIEDRVAREAAWLEGIARSHQEGWGPHHGTRVFFENVTFYVGSPTQTVELWTGHGGGDCGYTFEPGLDYLVFGTINRAGRAIAGECSGTTPLVCAREELLLLGEPESLVLPTLDEPVLPSRVPCLEWPKLHSDRRDLDGVFHRRIDVDLVIDREGRVSHFAFKDERPRPELERIIRAWCFKPAMLHGKPVPVRLNSISADHPR